MIPHDSITAWRAHAPWVFDHQVEQDLVISRALAQIYGVAGLGQRLAFRGGTALHKLYLRPPARYSEDIDLVQVAPEPIGETFDAIRSTLDPWLGTPRRDLKEGRVSLVYRFTSEDQPPRALRLKVEVNSREHFTELGYARVPFGVRSDWWSGEVDVTTFSIDELLGTKLRALYQRRKGRDLFDIWHAFGAGGAAVDRVVSSLGRYLREEGRRVTRAAFEENLAGKLGDSRFRGDLSGLLRPGVDWDIDAAGAFVMTEILARLPGDAVRVETT